MQLFNIFLIAFKVDCYILTCIFWYVLSYKWIINPLVLKVKYSWQCNDEKNPASTKVIAKTMQSYGGCLKRRSFSEYAKHLILAPEG